VIDIVDKKTRSRMMAAIKGKDTKGELLIRKALHKRGYRYRLHCKELPGRPDLVFAKYNAVIFVNGCFWHGHNCDLFKWPKTRPEFWRKKISGNRERDAKNIRILSEKGWRYCILWECIFRGAKKKSIEELLKTITAWLSSSKIKLELSGYDISNSGS